MDESDNAWDSVAAEWDQEATQAYAAAAFGSLQAALERHTIALAGARVVDFGAGTGLLTEPLVSHGAEVLAVDTSQAMLDVVERKIDERNWTGVTTATEITDAIGPYDLIVCSSVCSFLDDYPAVAAQLVTLLRPGGLFIQWDWELDEGEPDGHGLTRNGIHDALRAAGLEQIIVDTAFSVAVGDETMRPIMGSGMRSTNRSSDEPGSDRS